MDFYKNIAQHYQYIFPFSPAQLGFIEKYAPVSDYPRLLEIGSATGLLTSECDKADYKVQGLELDDMMVDIAQKNYPSLPFLCENMLNLNQHFEKDSFDVVVCFGNTLVHLDDKGMMKDFLALAYEVLSPNGRLLVQFINYDRIIDQKIDGLPTIDNKHITFERKYELKSNEALTFTGNLTIKESGLQSSSSQTLYPLRKDDFIAMANEIGFQTKAYGTFKSDKWSVDGMQSVVVCGKT